MALGGNRTTYVVVWREYTPQGTVMKGEPLDGKSDTDALSLVRGERL